MRSTLPSSGPWFRLPRPSAKIIILLGIMTLALNNFPFLMDLVIERVDYITEKSYSADPAPRYMRHEKTIELDCEAFFRDDEYSKNYIRKQRARRITMRDYPQLKTDCESIRSRGYYPKKPLSQMEADFPLAFSKVVYTDYLYLETLFRLEYAPQNVYCFTVDVKADPLFKKRIKDLQSCFPDNIIISKVEYNVSNHGYNLSSANWACVEEIKDRKWEYVFLLQNFDVKIKTNAELVRILKTYDGANDVSSLIAKTSLYDVKYNWTFASLNLFKDPMKNADKDSNGKLQSLRITKSLSEVTLSRAAANYILNNMNLTTYIKVLERGRYAMDEFFITSLNSNENVKLPGGYTTKCLDKGYQQWGLTRLTTWYYNKTKCKSHHWRHYICIFGMEDLRWVDQSKYFFANKIMAYFDFGALDCMLERVYNRTYFSKDPFFDLSLYENLPQVRYHKMRKEGRDLSQFNCT